VQSTASSHSALIHHIVSKAVESPPSLPPCGKSHIVHSARDNERGAWLEGQ
jgi:hypothetical protein